MTSAERAKALLNSLTATRERRAMISAASHAYPATNTGGDGEEDTASAADEKRIAEAIDAAVAEALPRWVPVWERLPEHTRPVLVTIMPRRFNGGLSVLAAGRVDYVPGPLTTEARYDGGDWYRGGSLDLLVADVLAWQPLPAPWVAP